MQNESSMNGWQDSKQAGKTGKNYKFICGYMTRVLTDANKTRVIYYSTPVVTFNKSTIVLNTGGWWTPTTQVRMNQASREFGLGFRVYQKQNDWFVEYRNETRPFTVEEITLKRIKVSRGGE